jgi:hypothetical protein
MVSEAACRPTLLKERLRDNVTVQEEGKKRVA